MVVGFTCRIFRLVWVAGWHPDQGDGPGELLVGSVQQAGVVRLGEALAPVRAKQ